MKAKYASGYYSKNRAKILKARKVFYKQNRKKLVTRQRAWKEKHRALSKRRQKRYWKKHGHKIRLQKYGVSLKKFFVLQKTQNNRCAICRRPFKKTPYVDHDHKTGRVRGLLCITCNVGLGMFQDSRTLLRKASEYLVPKK